MKKKEEGISLGEMLAILKKYLKLILLSAIAGLLVAIIISFFILKPEYSSSTELIVQAKDNNSSNLQSDINANVLLINTYKDMILGQMVLTEVSKDLKKENGINISPSNLKNNLEVVQSTSSMVFQIQATSTTPGEAAVVANTTALVFQKRASEVLDINKVTITSKAEIAKKPTSPNKKLNVVIGLMIGLIIGIIFAFILDALDNTVKDEWFIKNNLELPLMGNFSLLSTQEVNEGKLMIKSFRLNDNMNTIGNVNNNHITNKPRNRERV